MIDRVHLFILGPKALGCDTLFQAIAEIGSRHKGSGEILIPVPCAAAVNLKEFVFMGGTLAQFQTPTQKDYPPGGRWQYDRDDHPCKTVEGLNRLLTRGYANYIVTVHYFKEDEGFLEDLKPHLSPVRRLLAPTTMKWEDVTNFHFIEYKDEE